MSRIRALDWSASTRWTLAPARAGQVRLREARLGTISRLLRHRTSVETWALLAAVMAVGYLMLEQGGWAFGIYLVVVALGAIHAGTGE
jgi:hypothetical protein